MRVSIDLELGDLFVEPKTGRTQVPESEELEDGKVHKARDRLSGRFKMVPR